MKKDFKKDFDKWNKDKKRLDSAESGFDFHEREVWWCAIGVNVGSEQLSFSADFSRPVLVIRRFSPNVFWGVPLTTTVNDEIPYRVHTKIDGVPNDVLIEQMRAFDRRRLYRKITVMSEADFERVEDCIVAIIYKRRTPLSRDSRRPKPRLEGSLANRNKKSSDKRR